MRPVNNGGSEMVKIAFCPYRGALVAALIESFSWYRDCSWSRTGSLVTHRFFEWAESEKNLKKSVFNFHSRLASEHALTQPRILLLIVSPRVPYASLTREA